MDENTRKLQVVLDARGYLVAQCHGERRRGSVMGTWPVVVGEATDLADLNVQLQMMGEPTVESNEPYSHIYRVRCE